MPAIRPSRGDKRAARKARIHDDVGLQVAVHLAARRCAEGAAQGSNEAEHGLYAAPGPAKRQGQVANPQVGCVNPLQRRSSCRP